MPVEVVCGLLQAVKVAVEAVRGLIEAELTNSGFEIIVEERICCGTYLYCKKPLFNAAF
jgi:hypothetical protein